MGSERVKGDDLRGTFTRRGPGTCGVVAGSGNGASGERVAAILDESARGANRGSSSTDGAGADGGGGIDVVSGGIRERMRRKVKVSTLKMGEEKPSKRLAIEGLSEKKTDPTSIKSEVFELKNATEEVVPGVGKMEKSLCRG